MRKTVDENGKITINEKESKLIFGAYPNRQFNELFDIEGSSFYQKIRPHGVASTEFLLRQRGNNHIWIIEAKRTAPKILNDDLRKIKLDEFVKQERTNNRDKSDFLNELEKKVKYDIYFDELKRKFNDTLALIAAVSLKQHPDNSELSEIFLFSKEAHFNLVLVIKSNDTDIEVLQNLVQIKLNPLLKIWKLPANCVKVMNEQRAIRKGLISNNTPI